MLWYRHGLVLDAHRLVYHSAQGLGPVTRVKKKKKKKPDNFNLRGLDRVLWSYSYLAFGFGRGRERGERERRKRERERQQAPLALCPPHEHCTLR